MDNLEKAILQTLVYFDIFNYPLTLWEVWKWLSLSNGRKLSSNQHYSLSQIEEALNKMSENVESQDGFYFLSGHSQNIKIRLNRYNISEKKFKRARKYIKLLRYIPFIKCVIVCNRLAYSNVHQNSDIDLAVIVKKNRLWLTRFLSISLLSILKVRLGQISRSKAIDLSFFISEDSLNLESIKFEHDLIFPYWVNQFIPVYDQGIFTKFISENQWLNNYLLNPFPYKLNQRRQVEQTVFVKFVKMFFSAIFDWNFFEGWFKKYQLKIMPQDLKELMNKDSRVVINNQVLRLHRFDSWGEVQRTFKKQMVRLQIS